ncbi:short-chain dehydrogenase [Halobacillus andaensis]|uniref:Short-chain dehydrogenase n=1 Tax=Halobacillus andaensis TaxID=1176239 RepID=A0A917B5W9_HALAA|nr:SDR family oxidoreductase [Halobacillus andaensis]MBP2006000.1 short-subunit dehydrogenase [Halobacillus andaensis]GGF24396.1 short-chain dehydrogenase [Halobacillus andaensis]
MKPTALITGASGGIGYELAHLFAKAGYELIIVARSEIKLQQLKTELNDHPVTVIAEDLSHPNGAENVYHKVKEEGKTVEVLVNNAGFGLNGAFEELSLKEQKNMLQVNVHALTELTHYFLPDMKKAPFLNIPKGVLNVASVAAFQPGPRMAVYYASKAYVLSFTEALREELRGTGLTVSTLCPGATDTNFFKNANAEETKLVKRTMTPKDVANEGFLGFIKGKRVIIPGTLNRSMAVSTKLIPRSVAAKLAHYMDS